MMKKHHWYEKLFFRLQISENICGKMIFILLFFLLLSQILLTNLAIRQYLVLTEKYEGRPAIFYKSLNLNDL